MRQLEKGACYVPESIGHLALLGYHAVHGGYLNKGRSLKARNTRSHALRYCNTMDGILKLAKKAKCKVVP